jgi:hypothetical protein
MCWTWSSCCVDFLAYEPTRILYELCCSSVSTLESLVYVTKRANYVYVQQVSAFLCRDRVLRYI